MAKAKKEQGFWTTLPGILTGGAALLTAITGLIVGLYQYGVFSSHHDAAGDSRTTTMAAQATESSGSKESVESSLKPPPTARNQPKALKATVLITAQDGTATPVFADTFRQMREWDKSLHLLSGKTVAFDKIKAIEVVRDGEEQADVRITLLNDRVIEDAVGLGSSTQGFHGETEFGSFDLRMERLKRIDFRR